MSVLENQATIGAGESATPRAAVRTNRVGGYSLEPKGEEGGSENNHPLVSMVKTDKDGVGLDTRPSAFRRITDRTSVVSNGKPESVTGSIQTKEINYALNITFSSRISVQYLTGRDHAQNQSIEKQTNF